MGRKLLSVKEILVELTFRQKEKSTSSFYSDFHALPVRSQCCGLVESEARQYVWSCCCCSWGRSVLPVVSTFSLKAAWIVVYCHSGVLWKLQLLWDKLFGPCVVVNTFNSAGESLSSRPARANIEVLFQKKQVNTSLPKFFWGKYTKVELHVFVFPCRPRFSPFLFETESRIVQGAP